jgi:VWFA-related protein
VKRFSFAIAGLCLCGILISIAAPQQPAATQPAASQPAAPQTPSASKPAASPSKPQAPDESEARYTSRAEEVIVPVTVTDEKGKFISNLTAEDFRLTDEGQPQRFRFEPHREEASIVVGFLVDQSNSAKTHWKTTFKDVTKELIWTLVSGDKRYSGYLISYSTEPSLVMNTTTNGDVMAEKVDRMVPGGGASLHDAIYWACTRRDLVKGEPYEPRRVIIVIGDGSDNSSQHSLGEVLELAKRKQVTIYGLSMSAYNFQNADEGALEKLTGETGGRVEYPLNNQYKTVSGYLSTPRDEGNYVYQPGTGGYAADKAASIVNSIANLMGDIRMQYVLTYQPDIDYQATPKTFRHIKVEIPSLPNAVVRARDGYYPAPYGSDGGK